MNFVKCQSVLRPDILDVSSSKFVVYIRKNIVEKQRESIGGGMETHYEYEEAKLTKEEWKEYQKELEFLDIRQQRADIDYLAIMMDIEL